MLIRPEPSGLYCEQGGFYIDPSRSVDRAIITHAHADHARRGSKHYLCTTESEALLRVRLGKKCPLETLPYGKSVDMGGVRVSLHPAGHILGSAQVRVEYQGEVWVVSGDYKTQKDPTCTPFEPQACHTFISECTFGMPIYRWPSPDHEWQRMQAWWQRNREAGITSVIHAYSLGKAQRVLHSLRSSKHPILIHPSIQDLLPAYESQGVSFPKTETLHPESIQAAKRQALIVTPSAAALEECLGEADTWEANDVSGWAQMRSFRRKRGLPGGFVISDHADWDGLNKTIEATGASRVYLTHGDGAMLEQWWQKKGPIVTQLEHHSKEPEAQDVNA